MSTSVHRIAIVGAGPGGLSCAATLANSEHNFSVELFEKGRNYRARTCPVDIGKHCDGCKGICNVISGIGGAMHYGDSIKISGYPSGRRLFELVGEHYYWDLEAAALKLFESDVSDFSYSNVSDYYGKELRQYPVAEISPDKLKKITERIFSELETNTRVRLRQEVYDIKRLNDHYCISYSEQGEYKEKEFDSVIVATGRAGFATADKFLSSLQVEKSSPLISIGVRIELPSSYLSPLYFAHRDFKYTSFYNGLKVKSFCFSNHANSGGRLKYCHYQNEFAYPVVFLDGHSNIQNAEGSIGLSMGNFALLAQLPKEFDRTWLDDVFVGKYFHKHGGKPIYESMIEFLNLSINREPLKISVSDCSPGSMSTMLPKDVTIALRNACVSVAKTIAEANSIEVNAVIASANIIAPEVEFFWPTVNVGPNFETNQKNLYVIGDSAGVAQGNLQAAISGICVARDMMEKL